MDPKLVKERLCFLVTKSLISKTRLYHLIVVFFTIQILNHNCFNFFSYTFTQKKPCYIYLLHISKAAFGNCYSISCDMHLGNCPNPVVNSENSLEYINLQLPLAKANLNETKNQLSVIFLSILLEEYSIV